MSGAANFGIHCKRATYDIQLHSLSHHRGCPQIAEVYARDVIFTGYDEDNPDSTRISFIFNGDIKNVNPETGTGSACYWDNITKAGNGSATWFLKKGSSTKRVKKDFEYVPVTSSIQLSDFMPCFYNLKDGSNGTRKILAYKAEDFGVSKNPEVGETKQERFDPKPEVKVPIEGEPNRMLPVYAMYGGYSSPVEDIDSRAIMAMIHIAAANTQSKLDEIYDYVKALMVANP